MNQYPKRLIEVDLPIKRISAHARREKSIRHGHISTLHIWWARRPLAACRAVICAALWIDPVDELCPQEFREKAAELITVFAKKAILDKNLAEHCSTEIWGRWQVLAKSEKQLDPTKPNHLNILRNALLDFIADFANWDNSTQPDYLETSRALTQASHEALGGIPGTKPLVVDPFAGGGSIPLEALRVGADAFASDLNPVAVLLNKVVLEYIPKYGQRLADEVRKWGQWVKEEAEKELAEFYPKDPDGATPIAYLWARTIICEGPGCGVEVPLMRGLWLARKGGRSIALRMTPNYEAGKVDFSIIENVSAKEVQSSTVKRGSATCPCCGFTTPVTSVRRQLKEHHGGAADARLVAVVTTRPGQQGRSFRLPTLKDLEIIERAKEDLNKRQKNDSNSISLVPNEPLDLRGIRHTWSMIYGFDKWGLYFTPRQLLALTTLLGLIEQVKEKLDKDVESDFVKAVQTCLALALSKSTDLNNSICTWRATSQAIDHLFARQAVPMAWDFAEAVLPHNASGSWESMYNRSVSAIESVMIGENSNAFVEKSSATNHPLPDDSASAFITDPPYYDAVPYSYLSDFFYVWLRRSLRNVNTDLFNDSLVPKDNEIIVDRPHELSNSQKDIAFYERELTKAFLDGRRIIRPDGIGTIVFASKTTASWEAILQAVVDAGWVITGSWAIDTEMETRVAAQGQARLASSIHLVCRPRENFDGSLRESIGDWRDVLQELPQRIHEWMPRLSAEGVVGADAIFACLGPALEIFSRYSRVEKASGEQVTLKEYLEYVWAAVSKEALGMIFENADTAGFEEDARLTAMWLWTLSTGESGGGSQEAGDGEDGEDEEETTGKAAKVSGYMLEFDAARKIAQGLGAHLEKLETLVQVKGEKAYLLSVAERSGYLFGKEEIKTPKKGKKSNTRQLSLLSSAGTPEDGNEDWGDPTVTKTGITVLDRIHQTMILFAAGRSEALKSFLVDQGIGADQRFWTLAQALSALYPTSSDEKRWVDGVLARKKGLGF